MCIRDSTNIVFEPIDVFKGDFARTYFYMVTRYDVSSWTSDNLDGDGLSDWTLSLLLEWHYDDPVSQKEIDRNNAVYAIQNNRNPYIDHPEWVACVFLGQCGTEDPSNFVANGVSSSQIDLSWNLNSNNNPVLLAFNTSDNFGTPSGTYSNGQTISGGGTVLYSGTNINFSHTGLTQQNYYYKLWAYSGVEYSDGITAAASPILPEPSANVTNFDVSDITSTSISLQWTDAAGDVPPLGYLVRKGTTLEGIQNPVDGTVYTSNENQIHVAQNVETCSFSNLFPETEYFFKIFPYTNSGANINYKTDNTPYTSGFTLEVSESTFFISEIATRGYNGSYHNEYIELTNIGSESINLTNWTVEYYEGTTLEANLNITGTVSPNSTYLIAVRPTYNSIYPDFVPSTGFNMNNNCYVVLKNNGEIINQAGSPSDLFTDGANYEFTTCTQNNFYTSAWDNLGTSNGTPGVVNCADVAVEQLENLLNIFPNPTSDIVTITVNSNEKPNVIKFYNINGVVMKTFEFYSETVIVDISGLSAGIYFVELKNKDFIKRNILIIR